MGMGLALDKLAPHVKAAANEIAAKFNVKDIGGFATSGHIPGSDHYTGHALDVMVYSDKSKGGMIAQYIDANWKRLGVKYYIWYRRYHPSPGKSESYTGSSPHTEHVHISFLSKPGEGAVVDTTTGAQGGPEGCLSIVKTILGL